MIIGTAGHIDHGKSALVEALTGQRVDRLAEERRRGITVELNFVPLDLGDGRVAGVVDVPGHEDFVRTMVAGAAGMDLVLLVVAADEGIMPQTREHLAILEALGVRRGIPVITRCDLVAPEWAALVREEVASWLADSTVAFAPPHLVTATKGTGVEGLRAAVVRALATLLPGDEGAPFRMPIDRAFSVAGAGTVVTGSVWSGAIHAGDAARVLPPDTTVRVRAVEQHGQPVEGTGAGSRAALALAGLARDEVRRGHVVVDGRLPWKATTALDVSIRLLPEAPRALTPRTRVHLHLGTAETTARVLPRAPIPPGAVGWARLVCEAPVVALGGDRFVLRSFSPVTTIGGGRVLDPLPPRRRAAWPAALDSETPAERIEALLSRHPPGQATEMIALRTGLPVPRVVAVLEAGPEFCEVDGDWVLRGTVAGSEDRGLEGLRAYHAEHPADAGMSLETLRRQVARAPAVADTAIGNLVAAGRVTIEAGRVRLSGFTARLPGGEAAVDKVIGLVRSAGLKAPDVGELSRRLERVDVPGALRIGERGGLVRAVTRDWYLSREALDGFREVLTAAGREGAITVAGVRARTGLSRKYLIPLFEWADREGITRRDGDARRLT